MQDNYLDRIIRTKLQDLAFPLVNADWEEMSSRIDADFDAAIAEKLGTVSVVFDPADWEFMSEQLDQPFDTAIRNHLVEHELAFNTSDWILLSESLDQLFDEEIRDQLIPHQIPFLAADWHVLNERLDQPLDEAIRDQLLSFDISYEATDWALLSTSLDHTFDEMIRDQLVDLELPLLATDWRLLNERLNHPLDEAIRDQLLNHEVAYQAGDWEAMLTAMAVPFDMAVQAELTALSYDAFDSDWALMETRLDQAFDAHMREQIGDYEMLLQAGDWGAMAARLSPTRSIWHQSWMPIVDTIILLLLLMGWNFPHSQLPVLSPIQAISTDITALTEKIVVTPQLDISEISTQQSLSSTKKSSTEKVAANAHRASLYNETQDNTSVGTYRGEGSVLVPFLSQRKLVQDIASSIPQERSSEASPRDPFGLNRIEMISPSLNISAPSFSLQEETPATKPAQIRLGLSSSVFSSAAEFNDEGVMGGLVGFRLELPINAHLSIISGLQYGEKGFDRLVLNFAADNSGLSRQPTYWVSRLKGEINMLEIPLYVRYRFSPGKRIGLYFQGGLSAALTLDERYWNYDPRAVSNIAQMQTRTDIDFTRVQNNPVLETYLESIQPTVSTHTLNTYVGFLQLAPGVEFELSSKLFLQAEPYIQLGMQRIGSEMQRLHSLGGTLSLSYQLRSRR